MAFSKPNVVKRVALIISNDYSGTGKELYGTHKDSEMMEKVFKQFQYEVIKVKNVNKSKLEQYFTILSEQIYPPTCNNRIVVTFAGHGENGVLICQDLEEVKIEDMLKKFKPDSKNKPTLGNTVRIFFLDACRGQKEDTGYTARNDDESKEEGTQQDDTKEDVDMTFSQIKPVEGNIFVGYSSTRYHVTYETNSGGLFTSALAEKLLSEKDKSVNDVFIAANAEMKKRQAGGSYFQTAQCDHTLTDNVNFWKECQGTVYVHVL